MNGASMGIQRTLLLLDFGPLVHVTLSWSFDEPKVKYDVIPCCALQNSSRIAKMNVESSFRLVWATFKALVSAV